jgi:hypothetical protein
MPESEATRHAQSKDPYQHEAQNAASGSSHEKDGRPLNLIGERFTGRRYDPEDSFSRGLELSR